MYRVQEVTGKGLDSPAAERLEACYRLPIEVTGPTGDVQAVIVPLNEDAKRVYTLHGRRVIDGGFAVYHPLVGEAVMPADIATQAAKLGWKGPTPTGIVELLNGGARVIPLLSAEGERTGFIRAWEVE